MKLWKVFAATTAALAFSTANAAFVEGFEAGIPGNIITDGVGGSVTQDTIQVASGGAVYNPTEGMYMANLTASSSLSMNINVLAGETLSFDWAFLAYDYLPFNDFSLSVGDAVYTFANISQVGNYGDTGWQEFSMYMGAGYNGALTFSSTNALDNALDSVMLVDNIKSVSEPGTLALLGLGLLGLGFGSRRKAS